MKIGWVISGDKTVASSRLQGFLIHDYFIFNDIDSNIICTNFNLTYRNYSRKFFCLVRDTLKAGYDVVVFQRPNWIMYKFSELLLLHGVKTIAVRCDYYSGDYDRYFYKTIVPTLALQRILQIENYEIIDDAIEVPNGLSKTSYVNNSGKLKIVWVGHGCYREFIQTFIKDLNNISRIKKCIEFITISSGDWPTHKWSLDTVYENILSADIAIIPMPEGDTFQVKSTNRLTMMMSLGMPVIVSPIESYRAIAEDGVNCLLANTISEFEKSIFSLGSAVSREKMGQSARKFAVERYQIKNIGKEWLKVMSDAVEEKRKFVPRSKLHTRLMSKLIAI